MGSMQGTARFLMPQMCIRDSIGGGLKSGAAFKGVQIGGPSGGCLVDEQLDQPLDFDSV